VSQGTSLLLGMPAQATQSCVLFAGFRESERIEKQKKGCFDTTAGKKAETEVLMTSSEKRQRTRLRRFEAVGLRPFHRWSLAP